MWVSHFMGSFIHTERRTSHGADHQASSGSASHSGLKDVRDDDLPSDHEEGAGKATDETHSREHGHIRGQRYADGRGHHEEDGNVVNESPPKNLAQGRPYQRGDAHGDQDGSVCDIEDDRRGRELFGDLRYRREQRRAAERGHQAHPTDDEDDRVLSIV